MIYPPFDVKNDILFEKPTISIVFELFYIITNHKKIASYFYDMSEYYDSLQIIEFNDRFTLQKLNIV